MTLCFNILYFFRRGSKLDVTQALTAFDDIPIDDISEEEGSEEYDDDYD